MFVRCTKEFVCIVGSERFFFIQLLRRRDMCDWPKNLIAETAPVKGRSHIRFRGLLFLLLAHREYQARA
jgi:hypothetical protein